MGGRARGKHRSGKDENAQFFKWQQRLLKTQQIDTIKVSKYLSKNKSWFFVNDIVIKINRIVSVRCCSGLRCVVCGAQLLFVL